MTDSIKADAVFKALFDHHLHQDRIIWMQIRTILALQGTTLAASYFVRGTALVIIPAMIGIVFTSILYMFVLKVRLDRDMNMDTIQDLLREMSSEELKRLLPEDKKNRLLRTGSDLDGKNVSWNGWGFPFVRGHLLFQWAVFLAIAMDVVGVPFLYFIKKPLS